MTKALIDEVFVSKVYRAETGGGPGTQLLTELAKACRAIAADDGAGQAWSRKHAYPGYTSYASLNDLPSRFPEFADLQKVLDRHVGVFARAVDFDLGGRRLNLDSLWVNILSHGGFHAAHIHPHSVVSGTFYVAVPKGSGALKFEDPRLPLMMAAPPRKPDARPENRNFVSLMPAPGTLLLWESWMRHEVPVNMAKGERISISFNYRWD